MTTTWRDLVLAEIGRNWQPGQYFSRTEWLRKCMPAFEREFPGNAALEMSAQRVLQNLRDEGRVEFLGGGGYRLPAVDPETVSAPVADEDGVRRGLLTRTAYELLAEAAEPLPSSAIFAQVQDRMQLTNRELSTNSSGQRRWRTAVSVALSRSTFGGWLDRDDHGAYSLTEGGADALKELPGDDLWLEIGRRYQASKREGNSQGTGWDPFLRWARELATVVDLDAEERGYKVKAAEKWAAAGTACAANGTDWAERLKQACGAGNLIDSFAQTWLRNRILDHSEEVRTAFARLHTAGTVEAIDEFDEELSSWGEYVSPGDRTVFASCLLLGRDVSSFAPYRPALAKTWAERVSETAGTTPRERYTALLSLCDGLRERWVHEEPRLRDRLDAQGLGWVILKWPAPDTWPPIKRAALQHWRDGRADDVSVDRGAGICPTMEAAAWEVLGAGLRGEASALVSGIRSWSVENAQELAARFTTGESGQRFGDRLAQQLVGASDGVLCLAAELLYIRDAPLHDVKASTKAVRIGAILASMSGGSPLPEAQRVGLDDGRAFSGGQGYHARAPEHLKWLCRFVLHWLEQSPEAIDEALRDPVAFREVTSGVPDDSPSIRYVVEYLAWPGVYPSIVSASHRRKIRNGLISDVGAASGDKDDEVTRDLVALRALHERKKKGFVSWYDPPYVNRWRPGSATGPRAWLVRADAPEDVNRWLSKGCVELRDEAELALEPGLTLAAISILVADGYAHLPPSQREDTAVALHTLLNGMQEDDLVVTLTNEQLIIGTIEDTAPDGDDSSQLLTRPVLWSDSSTPLDTLPAKLSAALAQEGYVVDLTAVITLLSELVDNEAAAPSDSAAISKRSVRAMLPAVSESLADELFMSVAPLQELIDLLNRRRQLVIYGPPGTGKTYVAKKLAERLAGAEDPSRVRLVQFHPSYAYEDFFEGFRPVQHNGQAHFTLQDGPLKLMAGEAAKAENRSKPYVLVIDELNRANLAKVFGELYFLLEYREETVRLQYRPGEPFSLPDNLFIIGTMNTSDRSIALVDAAIRRRFPFYEMHPQREPVKGVLAKFAWRTKLTDDRVELLEELNATMGRRGHDLHIGPSYLMRDWLGEPGAIDLVWRYDILPLLHEHFYGSKSPEAVDQEFGLVSLRKRIEQQAKADGNPNDSEA